MRTFRLFCLSLLLPLVASAQVLGDMGGGGSSSTSATPVSAYSLTTAAPSGEVAIQQPAGSYFCLDGYTHAACILYDVVGDAIRSTKPLSAPSFVTTGNAAAATLTTTGTATVGSLSTSGAVSAGSVTSSTLTSTNTGNALVIPAGAKFCTDGATCAKTLTWNGSAFVFSDAVSGTSVTWSGAASAASFSASSTGNAVVIPSGAKLCTNGSGCSQYFYFNNANGAINANGNFWANALTAAANVDVGAAIHYNPTGLITCDGLHEAYLQRIASTGGASGGGRLKFCICMGDGVGGYFWRNLISGADGTATTC